MNANQPAEATAVTRPLPEPWLRGTLTEVPAVPRAVLHALELAGEDLQKWCGALTDAELNARPADLPPVAFHLRHIARSLDRLLTYAEGQALAQEQLTALQNEIQPGVSRDALFAELTKALTRSTERVRRKAATFVSKEGGALRPVEFVDPSGAAERIQTQAGQLATGAAAGNTTE